MDNLKEHGNGVCASEIDFVDSSTHLCNYCGKPYVYNAQSSHGMDVCVYRCAGETGHRVPSAGDHLPCVICGDWLCINSHGEGICGYSESTDASSSESADASSSESAESEPLGETKSLDNTLRIFTATFPDGTEIDMRKVEARKNIVVTAQASVEVKATASDDKATVSGDKGTLKLSLGKNSFRVIVTAEDETEAYFNFTITVNAPTLKPTLMRIPEPTPAPTPEEPAPTPEEPTPAPEPKPAPEPTPTPIPVKVVCLKCKNGVNTIGEHRMDCGHYSCDTDLSMEYEHEPGECGVSGHYWCDGNDHSAIECHIAGHYCGDGMRHFICAKCNGVFCDDKHRGHSICPD